MHEASIVETLLDEVRKEVEASGTPGKVQKLGLVVGRFSGANPDALRYELHRVWVVEGTLKEGQRHLYKRRTIYLDEDSWNVALADLYDNRDQLWRVSEVHNVNFYNVPVVFYCTEFHMDLQAGRYAVAWLNAEEPVWSMIPDRFTDADFTTQALRRMGKR